MTAQTGIKNILFVCTGNSCRSIMAEAYLKKRLEEEGLSIKVESAGTLGVNGLAPTREVLKVLKAEGINTSGYGSKELTEEFVEWADMILVMEPSHKAKVVSMVPGAADKVFFLGELDKEREDVIIPDPIGRTLAFYKASFHLIKKPIEELVKWLKK